MVLSCVGIGKHFGGFVVLHEVALAIGRAEILGVAGTDIAQFQNFTDREDGLKYEERLDRVLDRLERVTKPEGEGRIAVVGKYMDVRDAYKSIYESLTHAAASEDCGIDLKLIDAESLADNVDEQLEDVAGVLIPGGFGARGAEGKINAARYAREHRIPYLGLCLGMQVATIEFARNVCGIKDANSTEFDKDNPDPVISLLEEQRGVRNKGASMRLGTWPTKIAPGTLAEKIYGNTEVTERHRHRYELNNDYRDRLIKHGLVLSGVSPDGRLVEIVELQHHPWFLATQFPPEFNSRPARPHPHPRPRNAAREAPGQEDRSRLGRHRRGDARSAARRDVHRAGRGRDAHLARAQPA